MAGLIAQELEHDKTQAAAITPLKQLAEESKQHALAFKGLAKDGNGADEQQTTEKWTEFFEQHTNPSDYPFFHSKMNDSKPNPQKQPLNTATGRAEEAFKDLEFTAVTNFAANEGGKSQDILAKLKKAKSDIGGTFQLIRLLGVPVLSNEQAVSNIFETATGRKPHKMITTVVAKVAGFLKGSDNLQHNFMAHLPHFGKQRS
ncbi:MAG: hypothetical protein LW855_07350 [Alphaproteobacteria bacterium]|nr:hypothetical protein [Thalassospira sp.]MCE2965592.1 hypothetical protein [Alphaproteobacteria bacterium]